VCNIINYRINHKASRRFWSSLMLDPLIAHSDEMFNDFNGRPQNLLR
jgi:hypothetical protein